jgi:hypothetical protein
MRDIYAYGEKPARNGGKMVIYESQILRLTLYYLPCHFLSPYFFILPSYYITKKENFYQLT